ncbi:putative HTH-type transcriptional regulator [Streptomyces sp. YIM 130001]|uniref:AfsR/SARP family transcriptional regulator n=1 Tax=Streptomyces sp. YIM 130001 TaxID=2259644 RepID=UPI000E659ECE|nr:BTAD domain-containing putative transcriptional regulator [Streptomyces sp. YIM 130001]RII12043.1 putative HTH-type transcriptional regulator [Streptomyces sp. YIM 130001]
MNPVRYRVLGTTEAYDSRGTPLPVDGRRLRGLLAALALHAARPVSVDALVHEVWAGDPPRDAPAALQALVGRLRRVLGREAVESVPGGYRLAVDRDDVDLHRFERLARVGASELHRGDTGAAGRTLREALALWRGPALADLPDRAAATGPEARRHDAVRHRIAADLASGRTEQLVPELRELVAAHPYDEPLHAQLLRALRSAGRSADALAAYEDARRVLAEGLGTDPGTELRSLHAELLAGAEPGAGAGEPGAPAPDGAAPADDPVRTAARSPRQTEGTRGQQAELHFGAGHGTPEQLDRTPSARTPPDRDPSEQHPDRHPPDGHPPDGHPRDGQHPDRQPSGHPTDRPPARPERNTNLRPRLTSFVGRELELDAIRSDLQRARLVTLTGPGGSGKTRLAEETGAAHSTPVRLAELAPLDHPAAVPSAVVSALNLRDTALGTSELTTRDDDPVALLIEYCAPRSLLLILDNCEHVIAAAAQLAETLLTRCPKLRILATSREPLGVPGEAVRPVDPLPAGPAHRLFAERGTAVRPDFDPAADPDALAEICTRLDGLPLAIELAAARLRLLTPRQIADRLDDRFRLLTSGSRTVLPRQQTLRAVVDWSWDLLDATERRVLREVSVFAGGWDLRAAEAVCGPEATETVGALGALVDKSLIVAAPDPGAAGMRYRLLETIHEYADERAAGTPQLLEAARTRHTAYVRSLVEHADPLLRTADQLPWISTLERELDNIRAALHRSITTGDEESAFALTLAMSWFWRLRNYLREGANRIDQVLGMGPETSDEDDPRYWPRMKLRLMLLLLSFESGGTQWFDEEARDWAGRLWRAFGRPVPQAAEFPGLLWPFVTFVFDDPPQTRSALDEAVRICRELGDPWSVGVSLMFRTHTAVDFRGLSGFDDDLVELRDIAHRVGDRWMRAQVNSAAGEAAMSRSRFAEARVEFEEALHLAYEVGAYSEAPFLVARLGEIAYRSGDTALAQKVLAEALAESERYGSPDARTFVRIMYATIALDRGDLAAAGRELAAGHRESIAGSPPPQVEVVLAGLDARLTATRSSPAEGLKKYAAASRSAAAQHVSDVLHSALVDASAGVLADLGDTSRAARLLAVSDHWRGGHPRPEPERSRVERLVTRLRETLDPDVYETQTARGRGLTPDDVADELADAAARFNRPTPDPAQDAQDPGHTT